MDASDREDRTSAEPAHKRAWFLSPAITAVLFLAVQSMLLIYDAGAPPSSVAGAGAEVQVPGSKPARVTAEIHPVERAGHSPTRVPSTEAALLQLFEREGTVVFSADDVDVVATQEHRFQTEEVGVITAEPRLRRARFVRAQTASNE